MYDLQYWIGRTIRLYFNNPSLMNEWEHNRAKYLQHRDTAWEEDLALEEVEWDKLLGEIK
jgi:hypothetical protein